MKKYTVVFLLLISTACCAQKQPQVYRFKPADKDLSIPTAQIDSTLAVLKRRLIKAGCRNAGIMYSTRKNEFIVEADTSITEEFINNWLLKPGKIFFYETYTATELIGVLLSGPDSKKEYESKKAFIELLNITNSSVNECMASQIGQIRISDTSNFSGVIKALKPYLPADCIIAFHQKRSDLKIPALDVYALKDNLWKLPVHSLLDEVKVNTNSRRNSTLAIRFNEKGKNKFAAITEKNINKAIAIVVDGLVYSAPFVNGKIEGGNAEISSDFNAAEAKRLSDMLSCGYLPVNLTLIH